MRKDIFYCKKKALASIALFFFLVSSSAVWGQGNESHEFIDLQKYIDTKIDAGQKKIVLAKGKYRVTPKKRQHLVLANLENVEIDGSNAEIICTETTRAISINNCSNLTLKSLVIDYDPLPFTQGKITKLSKNNTVHDIELFDGYPKAEDVIESKYEIFEPDKRILRFGSYHNFTIDKLSSNQIRITRTGPYHGEQVGDIIAIAAKHAPGGSIAHAVYVNNSKNVVLEDITLYSSNCFGFFETNSNSTIYRRCVVDRRPAGNDLKKRQSPRIRSLNADAFHSKYAAIGPQIIDCKAHFQGDDCVNICGSYYIVMGSNGSKIRVLTNKTVNIKPGDSIEILTYQGNKLPNAKAISIKKYGTVAEDELIFMSKQKMHRPYRQGALKDVYEVEVDRKIELPRGSLICAKNRTGSGFKVAKCDFGFNRSRGILTGASNGMIFDNQIEQCWGEAIKIAPEFWWLLAGSSDNINITGNNIKNCFSMGIAVYAYGGSGKIAPSGLHNNIKITNNVITDLSKTDIWITSTRGLILQNNKSGADKTKINIINCQEIKSDVKIEASTE